jgi:LysM repeat protein
MRRTAVLLTVLTGIGLVLYECVPPPAQLLRAAASGDPDEIVLCLVGALAVMTYGWLVGCLAITAATALPGWLGQAARSAQAVLVPICVRRLVAGVLGAGMAFAPLTATSAAPAGSTASALSDHDSGDQSGVIPNPLQASASSPGVSGVLPKMNTPARPHHATTPPRGDGRPNIVVVRPGDTLWGIAAEHLGGHPRAAVVAAEWPRWWAANRVVIGSDPDLIHPGQRLRTPSAAGIGRTS